MVRQLLADASRVLVRSRTHRWWRCADRATGDLGDVAKQLNRNGVRAGFCARGRARHQFLGSVRLQVEPACLPIASSFA
jgi:hypothetical protein